MLSHVARVSHVAEIRVDVVRDLEREEICGRVRGQEVGPIELEKFMRVPNVTVNVTANVNAQWVMVIVDADVAAAAAGKVVFGRVSVRVGLDWTGLDGVGCLGR